MIEDKDIIQLHPPKLSSADKLYVSQIAAGMKVTLKHLLAKPCRSLQYPEQKREQRVDNYRGVHRLNRDPKGRVACVACFMCQTACPANCITIVGGEAPWDDREKYPVSFEIDELRCIYCGMCEYACPVDAIELTPIYEPVGRSREEMIYDKDKLLQIFDETVGTKKRKNPKITGYELTGDRSAQGEGTARIQQAEKENENK